MKNQISALILAFAILLTGCYNATASMESDAASEHIDVGLETDAPDKASIKKGEITPNSSAHAIQPNIPPVMAKEPELYVSPDAEPKLYRIFLSGYDPAPKWVHLSALLIDGLGRDIELPDIDEGGPYQFDDAELFCPGQVMIKIFVYVDDTYLDGETVESHGKIYCDSCVFDLSDDAFEEYVEGIQRGELSASMSIVYDPDPDNHAEHDAVYEEYLLNIEVSIEREY